MAPTLHQTAANAPAVARDTVNVPTISPSDLVFAASSDIESLKRAWRAFELRAAGHVFQTYNWVSIWHRHIGTRHNIEPFIVTATGPDGRLRLLLPFGIQTRKGLRVLCWLGGDQSDYKGPLIDRELLAALDGTSGRELVDAALRLAPGIDAIQLTDMQAELEGYANPFARLPHQQGAVSAHHCTLEHPWEEFYKNRRSRPHRKNDRKKRRRLSDEIGDPVQMCIARSSTERARAISALVKQKRARLAEMGVGDIFADAGVRAFYRAMAEEDPVTCQLSTFEANGEIMATNWGLVWGDRYYYVLSTMSEDPEMRAYSPGMLHLHDLIQWAIGRHLNVFDFTAGDEGYKSEWCNGSETLIDVYEGVTNKGRVFAALKRFLGRTKRTIKQDERLWKLAFKTRCRLHALRTHTPW